MPAVRPSAPRVFATHRQFSIPELAFFAVPRAWNSDLGIDRRFEAWDDQDLRDAITYVDDEPGGLGFLEWDQPTGTWVLSKKGVRYVSALAGEKILQAGARWAPTEARLKKAKYATRASESSCNVKPKKAEVVARKRKAEMDLVEGPILPASAPAARPVTITS